MKIRILEDEFELNLCKYRY